MRRLSALTMLVSLGCSLAFGASLAAPWPASVVPCAATRLFDDAAASKILATKRPFAPGDRNLFLSFQRPDWADVAPMRYAEGPAPSEQAIKEQLRTFLTRRFPCSPQRVLDGLAVYTDPIARQKIPDPTLRAALAALTGTLGEPAINYLLLEGPVAMIHFGVVIFYGEGIQQGWPATVYHLPDGTYEMVFDGHYRFNPFGTLSALMFHEALHIDLARTGKEVGAKTTDAGLPEEATAVALESLVYMQMLLTDPTLATLPDPETRGGSNHMALIRLNSGVAGTDRLNLFVPGSDVNIDPTAADTVTQFFDLYAHDSYGGAGDPAWRARESVGTPLLAAVLPALAEPGHSPPAKPDFDQATLDFIDQNQAVLSPGQLLAVACILKLDVPCA